MKWFGSINRGKNQKSTESMCQLAFQLHTVYTCRFSIRYHTVRLCECSHMCFGSEFLEHFNGSGLFGSVLLNRH